MTSALSVLLDVSQAQTCQLARPEADSAGVLINPAVKPAGINDTEGLETARLHECKGLLLRQCLRGKFLPLTES